MTFIGICKGLEEKLISLYRIKVIVMIIILIIIIIKIIIILIIINPCRWGARIHQLLSRCVVRGD